MQRGGNQVFASPGEALQHFGVKGMRWGVRKEETTSSPENRTLTSQEKKARAKKVAIGAGVLVAVAGAAFVAYKLHQSGHLSLSDIRKAKPSPQARKVVKEVREQTDILHVSHGKKSVFTFYKRGGLQDPLSEYEKVFGTNEFQHNMFKRLNDGRVAASFRDPHNRKDHAGRMVEHQIIVPKSLSGKLNTITDVIQHIWPKLQDTYNYDA